MANLENFEAHGLELHGINFFVKGYSVNKEQFSLLGKALLKGEVCALGEGKDVDKELSIQGGTPSFNIVNLSLDE